MAQLHCIHKGLDVVRPTNDVDIVLHVETTRGVAAAAAAALESLGYELSVPTDPRVRTAHRFRRGPATVDLLTSPPDLVDVLVADHAAPRVAQKLRGRTMVAIEGGTQALRRTVNARLGIVAAATTTVSDRPGGGRRRRGPGDQERRYVRSHPPGLVQHGRAAPPTDRRRVPGRGCGAQNIARHGRRKIIRLPGRQHR